MKKPVDAAAKRKSSPVPVNAARLDRRRFLIGAGGAVLALPVLQSLQGRSGRGGVARAQSAPSNPRLLVVMHGQGTMNDRWTPTTTGASFALSPLLAPLAAHQDKLTVLSGLNNEVATMMGGNGHNKAGRSLLTAEVFSGGGENGNANGPSVDQVIAQRIGTDTLYRSVHLQASSQGVGEYQLLFAAKDDPVGAIADPNEAFNTLFASLPQDGAAPPPPPATLRDKLRSRRPSVLDAVSRSFTDLSRRVSAEDRVRLDLHAEKIRELERLANAASMPTAVSASCGRPVLGLPADFDPYNAAHDQYFAPAQMKNAAMALACGLTRVVTVQFTDYHGPTFPWTGATIPGSYANWHAMIHRDGGVLPGRDQAVETAMLWYTDQFKLLLDELASFDDGGVPLLDNTLVLWISEFGDGGTHDTTQLPVVLAGGLGGALKDIGQHLAFNGRTTNDLFVTLLNLFGGTDTSFGYGGASLNKGVLPGVG